MFWEIPNISGFIGDFIFDYAVFCINFLGCVFYLNRLILCCLYLLSFNYKPALKCKGKNFCFDVGISVNVAGEPCQLFLGEDACVFLDACNGCFKCHFPVKI